MAACVKSVENPPDMPPWSAMVSHSPQLVDTTWAASSETIVFHTSYTPWLPFGPS